MQRKLSVSSKGPGDRSPTMILAALRNRQCLQARYNGGDVVLAPYLYYERHEVPHLAAVTMSRDGKALEGGKLAVYRLTGLTGLSLTGHPFEPATQLLESHAHPVDRLIGSVAGVAA